MTENMGNLKIIKGTMDKLKVVKKYTFRLATTIIFLSLTACVTHSGSTGPKKVDKAKALESNIRLGMAYLQQEQRDNALRAFSKALEIDKRSAEAHQGMALIHNLNGEYDLAEKSFLKALKARSDFSRSDIQYTYARFLIDRKRYSEALPLLESATKDLSFRRRPNALFSLAQCAEKMGDRSRALAAYKHALNLNPQFAPAALEIAHKSFASGDYANAKKHLDIYSKNSRQSARSLWLGIRIERVFGNTDKEASYALALKNLHPYSREYLKYKKLIESNK
ncbi:type IV pilus biogenesis/stability protein PilW [Agarilytica rhodophyticola]|uniref:type IV pilus biogenesis/stability protein PilW n=1 Tax=Agarilytica rhodophyticola TaxID=1737490 RepID=UPI001FE269CC|nr:type IV pilus biogenesis/stability protein PilW [Agarilytica rhodophyticola]